MWQFVFLLYIEKAKKLEFGMNFVLCRSTLVPPALDLLRMANFHRVAYLRTPILSDQSARNIFLPAGLQSSPAGITDSVLPVPFRWLRACPEFRNMFPGQKLKSTQNWHISDKRGKMSMDDLPYSKKLLIWTEIICLHSLGWVLNVAPNKINNTLRLLGTVDIRFSSFLAAFGL